MNRRAFIQILVLFTTYLFPSASPLAAPHGKVIGKSECKYELSENVCVEYQYYKNILLIKHINACFNCCMKEVSAKIDIKEGTISIRSSEEYGSEGPCDCLCAYEIAYEIRDLEPGSYYLIIDNTAAEGDDEVIRLRLDLDLTTSDKKCWKRR